MFNSLMKSKKQFLMKDQLKSNLPKSLFLINLPKSEIPLTVSMNINKKKSSKVEIKPPSPKETPYVYFDPPYDINESSSNATIGFVILRHVNDKMTNNYWKLCYQRIRKFYPENDIVIIDDNSNPQFLTEHPLYKTTVIQSEFPKRGELLMHYYYAKNKWFDIAVMIHDSVFINRRINFYTNDYKILWDFKHDWDIPEEEVTLIKALDNNAGLLKFFNNKERWTGCFGCMCVVRHEYLKHIDEIHNLSKLLNIVTYRLARCHFERAIACLLQYYSPRKVLFTKIQDYCPWGITFDQRDKYYYLPMTKVWTGR